MAINPHDIVQRIPIRVGRMTTASGVCDTLGADWALIRLIIGSQTGGATMFGARPASATTQAYSTLSQFPGGVVGMSGVTRSGVSHAWLVNLRSCLVSTNGRTYGGKRYLRLRLSTTSGQSNVCAAIVDLKWNNSIPPAAITTASTAFVSGFASFTVIQ